MKFIKRKNIDTYKPKSYRLVVENDGRAIINTDKTLTLPLGNTAARPGSAVPGMVRYNTQTHDFEVFTDYGSWGWEKIRTDRPSDITFAQIGTGSGTGEMSSISIVAGGTGYAVGTTITFSAPDVGSDTATANITLDGSGVITGYTFTNLGSGYISTPTITINTIGGAGNGANLVAVLSGDLEYTISNNYIPTNSLGALSPTNVQVYVENVYQLPGINYSLVSSSGSAKVRFDSPIPFGKPVYVIYGFDK